MSIRSLILVLAGTVAASVALLFLRRDAPSPAAAEREVSMDRSRVSSRDLNIAAVFLTAGDQGVRKALDSLEALAKGDEKLRGMGHVLARALGRFAIAQRKDVGVLAECREVFQAGCYHGVLEGHLSELPDVQPAAVASLCDVVRQAHPESALPALECAHGLGHGLLTRFGYSLDRATQACDALPAADARRESLDGVFMENLVHGTGGVTVSVGDAAVEAHQHAVSIGGALGGVVTLLLPPLVTTRMVEYPVALVLATLVLAPTEPVVPRWRDRIADVVVPVALVAVVLFVFQRVAPDSLARWVVLVFAPSALFVLAANTRGAVFTLRLGALFAASLLVPSSFGTLLFAERSFYGRVRVMHDEERNANVIVHGSTVHGVQRREEMAGCAPTSYYHPTGPAGRYLEELAAATPPRRVALIGLGAGALVCYARPGETWDLLELDPGVARIASDTAFFTYLAHSRAAVRRIVVGDARLALAREPAARYDLVIVDAFSSDAIPIHLLTREAIEGYLRTLTLRGALLFHVSNRFFRLPPVLAAVAPVVQLEAFVNDDPYVTPAQFAAGKYESEWVILTRAGAGAALGPRWRRLVAGATRPWTDDYSNPLGAMGWFGQGATITTGPAGR